MQAVVLETFGGVEGFRMKEVAIPQPQEGEVRIRVRYAGFNPVDYKMRQSDYFGSVPLILGADCSGVIDALGSGVSAFSVGDEVYAMPFLQCSNGSYAEFLTLPASFVAKKPSSLSWEQAAAIPLAGMTAYRALIAPSSLKKADTLFIAGAGGGVGSLAVQMARSLNPKRICTVAGSEESAQFLVQACGLQRENILIYTGLSFEQMREKLIDRNEGRLFDATLDCVGQEMKRLCLHLTKHSGHCASIVPERNPLPIPVWEAGASVCFNRNLSVHFIFLGAEAHSGPKDSWEIYQRHLSAVSQMVEKAQLQPQQIQVVGDLCVESVVKAHRLLEGGRVKGKLVMRVHKE